MNLIGSVLKRKGVEPRGKKTAQSCVLKCLFQQFSWFQPSIVSHPVSISTLKIVKYSNPTFKKN